MPSYQKLLSFPNFVYKKLTNKSAVSCRNKKYKINVEKTNKEMDTVFSQMKVLAIGDKEQDSVEDIAPPKHDQKEDFQSHMRYLLLGTRKPVEIVDDWDLVDRFGASVHNVNDIPKSYTFHCHKGNSYPPEIIISGTVFSGREIMDKVKQRLSKENWISENTISTPIKEKLDNYYHNRYCFIQQIVNEALETESNRLFQFLLFLHRENGKNRKIDRFK